MSVATTRLSPHRRPLQPPSCVLSCSTLVCRESCGRNTHLPRAARCRPSHQASRTKPLINAAPIAAHGGLEPYWRAGPLVVGRGIGDIVPRALMCIAGNLGGSTGPTKGGAATSAAAASAADAADAAALGTVAADGVASASATAEDAEGAADAEAGPAGVSSWMWRWCEGGCLGSGGARGRTCVRFPRKVQVQVPCVPLAYASEVFRCSRRSCDAHCSVRQRGSRTALAHECWGTCSILAPGGRRGCATTVGACGSSTSHQQPACRVPDRAGSR